MKIIKNKTDTLKRKSVRIRIGIGKIDKYKIWGTTASFSNVQDLKTSPMIYSGPGCGINRNSYKTLNKFTYLFGFNAHYAALLGPVMADSYIHGVKIRLNKGALYQLNSKNWKIGGSTNIETNARIYPKIGNDVVSAEILASINFAASYSFDFMLFNGDNTFDIKTELPFFAYVLRFPDYNIQGFKNLYMPIGKFNALRTTFTLIKPFKYSNENKYSISYEWDFYMFNENSGLHKLVYGGHFITFSYWLKKR